MDFFDLHCDTPSVVYDRMTTGERRESAVSLDVGCFSRRAVLPAIFVDDGCVDPFKVYSDKIRCFKEYKVDRAEICIDVTVLDACFEAGRCAWIFSVENGHALDGKVDNLYRMHRDGVRVITLTWNGKNELGGGCRSYDGLTEFGRSIIDEMNRLGMAVDTAHMNERTFFEALRLARFPICTHTACRALNDHPRNLSDEQIRAVASRGGLIGLCFYPVFLGVGDVFENAFCHFSHLLSLGVEDSIAVGSDFDGCKTSSPLARDGDVPAFFDFLCRRGIKKSVLEKIFFKNSYKYFHMLLTNGI